MNKITISAGVVIIVENMILFAHPTNSSPEGRYSFPKGHVEEGEEIFDAAVRECKEEVGLDLKKLIPRLEERMEFSGTIDYINKDKVFKKVHYYVLKTSLEELKLSNFILPKEMLQLEEVDEAEFLTKEEIEKKALWRFKFLKKYLE